MNKTAANHVMHSGTFLLGKTLPIYRLGFGAMKLTGPGAWGEPKNRNEAIALLRRVIEAGVNFIDTADAYGPEVSENLIAEALYPYPNNLIIATKGGSTRPGPGQWGACGRADYLTQCVERSLQRLRKESIDLYQLHTIDHEVPFEESLMALKKMQQEGKIRYIGLSNVSLADIERAKKMIEVVSIQNHYNLIQRASENIVDYCQHHQMAFIPWYPLENGGLAKQYGPIEKIANIKGATTAQIALAWLLKRSPVMVPIPGTASLSHFEENLAASSIHLTQLEYDSLSAPLI